MPNKPFLRLLHRSAVAAIWIAAAILGPAHAQQSAMVEKWKGSVKLVKDELTQFCSPVTSNTEFTLEVAADGKVSGTGTFDHGSWTCVGGFTAPATHVPIKIGGKKEGGTFTIFLKDFQATNALVPRLPTEHWIVPIGERSAGEAMHFPFPHDQVGFSVKLERISKVVPRG
jgi:hypothetical protein